MKQILLVIAALVTISVAAQAQYDSNQVRRVGSLPATCTLGTTNPVTYQGVVYHCTATNTWTKSNPGQIPTSTYAGLPTCAAGNDGQLVRVTDKNRDLYSCYGTSGKWVSRNGGAYNVKDFGAVGDGATNDTTAINAALASAKSDSTISGAATVDIPAGYYLANISIIETKGLKVRGAGKLSTKLQAYTSGTATLDANGLWFSSFEGITFVGNGAATEVVRLDGNYDGSHTLTVQGNSFKDCYFGGGTGTYVTTISRSTNGQGSENIFINCHWEGNSNSTALYYQAGYNALNNTIVGGNFQSYPMHGIQLNAGSLNVFSTGFQSTYKYAQIVNGGYDIDASSGGAYERIIVDGCRSESMRFFNGAFSQYPIIRGLTQATSVLTWGATTAFALNDVVIGRTAAGYDKIYRVTTAGTTGGSQPTWPESGTVSDGSITWTQLNFNVVNISGGTVQDSYFDSGGLVACATNEALILHNRFTRGEPSTATTGTFRENYRMGAGNTYVALPFNATPNYSVSVTASSGGTTTLDLSIGSVRIVTMPAGNTTLTATNIPTGPVWISITQDNTGSRLVTWNALFLFAGGTKPFLTTTASATDQFQFICNGSTCTLQSAIYDVK